MGSSKRSSNTTTKSKTKVRLTGVVSSDLFDRTPGKKIVIPAVVPDYSRAPMPKRKMPSAPPKSKTKVGFVINPQDIDRYGKKIANKARKKIKGK